MRENQMPTLPKRLTYEILILSALAVSSCAKPEWEDRLDVADVNARNAIVRVNSLETRVEELEQRLNM
jgi:hypothetical protein